MKVISKAEWLDLYENDKIIPNSIVSMAIAVVCKVKPDPANPSAKIETVVVNIP